MGKNRGATLNLWFTFKLLSVNEAPSLAFKSHSKSGSWKQTMLTEQLWHRNEWETTNAELYYTSFIETLSKAEPYFKTILSYTLFFKTVFSKTHNISSVFSFPLSYAQDHLMVLGLFSGWYSYARVKTGSLLYIWTSIANSVFNKCICPWLASGKVAWEHFED